VGSLSFTLFGTLIAFICFCVWCSFILANRVEHNRVEQAIKDSQNQEDIVFLPFDEDLRSDLEEICDECNEDKNHLEFSGEDENGKWEVHLLINETTMG